MNIVATLASQRGKIQLIDTDTGAFYGLITVTTSGDIVGTPMISGDLLTVQYSENGHLYLNKYQVSTSAFYGRQQLS